MSDGDCREALGQALTHAAEVSSAAATLGRLEWVADDGSHCYSRQDGDDLTLTVTGGGRLDLVSRYGGVDRADRR
ncbi:MAG: hypothetical protein ACRDRH_17860 [Pseudonocardia sp.]